MLTPDQKAVLIGYIRVSTQHQADSGFGLDAQTDAINTYARRYGKSVPSIHEDHTTGVGKDNHARREGLTDAIREATDLGVPLIITDISRLSRDPSILEELEKSKLTIVSISNGGIVSKKTLRAAIDRARFEAAEISRRSTEALVKAKSRGVKERLINAFGFAEMAVRALA